MITILDSIYQNVESLRDKSALIFLKNGEQAFEELNYQQVWTRSMHLASKLANLGCRNKTCLLLLPSGMEYAISILACFLSRTTAVPLYSANKRNLSIIENIALDCKASFAIISESDNINSKLLIEGSSIMSQLEVITYQNEECESYDDFDDQKPSLDDLAFIQYTSGSTGSPKGVMLTHRNIADNLACIQSSFDVKSTSVVVSWLPFFHDMGLMGNILSSLGSGCTLIFMPPPLFLQKPKRWLMAIEKYKATHTGGPNFSFELCVKKITSDEASNIDLSSLEVLYNGGESVKRATLENFTKLFQPSGFLENVWRPCYGMAEATVFISVKEKNAPLYLDSKWVNCGISYRNNHVIICNPETLEKCDEGTEGEILFKGDSLFKGYYNSKERPFVKIPEEVGVFYRTGDLGFMKDSHLYVTGRINDLIIINGKNYYPQDIEHEIVSQIKSISISGVFSLETETNAELVIFAELERNQLNHADGEAISAEILNLIFAHFQLPVAAIKLLSPGQLPRTTSGKVQRHKCKEAHLAGTNFFYSWEKFAQPKHVDFSTDLKGLIAKIIADKSDLNIEQLNENTNFSELGINSASIIELVEELSLHTGKELDPTLLFEYPSIGALAAYLDDTKHDAVQEIVDWLKTYGSKNINSFLIDERRTIPPNIVLDFGNKGILGMIAKNSKKSLGFNIAQMLLITQHLAAIDSTLAMFVGLNNALGIYPIDRYGSTRLKESYLDDLVGGRILGAFAYTEPNAGSNMMAIKSTATPVRPGVWELNGEKIWSGSAAWAGLIHIFVKELDKEGNLLGISAFSVPANAEGLIQGEESLTMGLKGMVQNAIQMNGVEVHEWQRIADANQGREVAKDIMSLGRLGISAAGIGIMKRSLHMAGTYVQNREIGTGLMIKNQFIQKKLNESILKLFIAEQLMDLLVNLLDRGEEVPFEVFGLCKVCSSEYCGEITDQLIQLLGGRGYIETNFAPRISRDARILRIFEGPTEALLSHAGNAFLASSNDTEKFISTTLGCPDIARTLLETCHELIEKNINSKPVLSNAIGHLILCALQEAAIESNRAHNAFSSAVNFIHQQQKMIIANCQEMITPADLFIDQWIILNDQLNPIEQQKAGPSYVIDDYFKNNFDKLTTPTTVRTPKKLIESPLEKEIEFWLRKWLSEEAAVPMESIKSNDNLIDYGLDSINVQSLILNLEEVLNIQLNTSIFWEYPTIIDLSRYLAGETRLSSIYKNQNIKEPSKSEDFKIVELEDGDWDDFHAVPEIIYAKDKNYIAHQKEHIEYVFNVEQDKNQGIIKRFIAERNDGELLGRIAVYAPRQKAESLDYHTGRIGFFESVNDEQVAFALFDHANNFLKSKGLEGVEGPVNFGERDMYWGLLVGGFEEPLYQENYNLDYYQDLFRGYGFKDYMQTFTFKIDLTNEIAPHKITEGFTVKTLDYEQLEDFAADFVEVYNDAFGGYRHFRPMESERIVQMAQAGLGVIDPQLVSVFYMDGEPVGIMASIPDLNQLMTKGDSSVLKGVAFGIKKEFQLTGIYMEMLTHMKKEGLKDKPYKSIYVNSVSAQSKGMINILRSIGGLVDRYHVTYRLLYDVQLPLNEYKIYEDPFTLNIR